MPTSAEPISEGSDFYVYVPVVHANGTSFNVQFNGGSASSDNHERAIQDLIDYLNAWPNRMPGSEPVAGWKNFVQQYVITSPVEPEPEPEPEPGEE